MICNAHMKTFCFTVNGLVADIIVWQFPDPVFSTYLVCIMVTTSVILLKHCKIFSITFADLWNLKIL